MAAKKTATTGFSERLKLLREQAGLTQQALADKAGLNLRGLTKLEYGEREPAWETAIALARALGVPLDAFVVEVPPVQETGQGEAQESAGEAKRKSAKPKRGQGGQRGGKG